MFSEQDPALGKVRGKYKEYYEKGYFPVFCYSNGYGCLRELHPLKGNIMHQHCFEYAIIEQMKEVLKEHKE